MVAPTICLILRTRPYRVGHYTVMTVFSPSVCLSVCPVPDPKLRTEGHSKLSIGRREAHDTGDPWPQLESKMSKFKVSRPSKFEILAPCSCCHLANTNKKQLLSFTKIRLIILHCNKTHKTSCRRAAATICPAPLLPLWAPKRLTPQSTPQRSFPRPIRSHTHRCSYLTR